jgi:hypothetical protein
MKIAKIIVAKTRRHIARITELLKSIAKSNQVDRLVNFILTRIPEPDLPAAIDSSAAFTTVQKLTYLCLDALEVG